MASKQLGERGLIGGDGHVSVTAIATKTHQPHAPWTPDSLRAIHDSPFDPGRPRRPARRGRPTYRSPRAICNCGAYMVRGDRCTRSRTSTHGRGGGAAEHARVAAAAPQGTDGAACASGPYASESRRLRAAQKEPRRPPEKREAAGPVTQRPCVLELRVALI